MQVEVLNESGLEQAILGMAYSYKDRAIPWRKWWTPEQREKALKRAALLAGKGLGHDKFLESIVVWVHIEGTRGFWSEFDTYRVGTTKQSESTMHTLAKRAPEVSDFDPDTPLAVIAAFREVWDVNKSDINVLKAALPEGFLQARVVCTNYKSLRNIIAQRAGHRLKQWGVFIDAVLSQVEHPEFLQVGAQ